jgi:prepilin-type N-terminal cleavage/methylation domain-containing protein
MRKKGFSIVELIVVIIVMGFLTSLAIPAFRAVFARSRLEEAGNGVIAFYQRVNRYAASEGVNYVLQIDVVEDSLRCMKEGVGVVKDKAGIGRYMDLSDSAGANITFTIEADGFVRDNDGTRRFVIYDSTMGKTLRFYISPLGIMEVN